MGLLSVILWWLLQILFLALLGRLAVDLVRSVNPSWRPKGMVLVLLEIIMTITDVPLNFVRRFIPPIRMGAIAFDLGWTLLVMVIFFAQRLVLAIA
ncbi:YggT family protein [Rhodoluna sp. KAS3]|jgi:YggT family protein|uniref:YggT family protein n=1 Tax=Rhodoluna sp. KAS3 TaxID=942880 RepID=UPI002230C3D9|nr:YggT family protein [Rhodoluna sp. KAS3]BDS48927.1 membrane protein [Rhodoluna sp. KAS3]